MPRGPQTRIAIELTPEQRRYLESWQRATTQKAGLVRRAKIILLLAQGLPVAHVAAAVGIARRHVYTWATRFRAQGLPGLQDRPGRGRKPTFAPAVAAHTVKRACQRPEMARRSLSQWDCVELARQLVREGVVASISAQTVRRILSRHHLKPWRHHPWMHPKGPYDAAFGRIVEEIIDLYTRPLPPDERVVSLDEKTSLQPRPRVHPTLPAQPGGVPNRVEHEYARAGALQLFAAFDTRTGTVYGKPFARRRQQEFIAFLAHLEQEIPASVRVIHLVCDNLKVHSGKQVQQWLQAHPRFEFHFTPVHCSWLNQIEQWFSILQRKRLRIADFASKAELAQALVQFIEQWNERAHPFNWSTKSVAKVMAKVEANLAA